MPRATYPFPHITSVTLQAILWMCFTGFLATSINCTAKYLSHFYSPFQLVFFYNATGFITCLPWLLFSKRIHLPRRGRENWFILRGLFEYGGFALVYYTLAFVPFPTITALQFMSPVFATFLAVFILKEQAGKWVWLSLAIGFGGVLLITQPGVTGFQPVSLLMLAGSFCFAVCSLLIKVSSRIHNPMTVAFWMLFFTGLLSLPMAIHEWKPILPEHYSFLIMMGILVWTVQITVAKSFGKADMTIVLPFVFPNLLWSSLYSAVFFGEMIRLSTALGALVIILSAVIALHSARRAKRAQIPEGI